MAARALLADIGGTNTRVALAEDGVLLAGSVRRYRNAEFPALDPVLRRYRDETACGPLQAACLAMAGPVRDGAGQLTNLDWTLTTELLSQATGAPTVALLNDLQAQGHALGRLAPDAIETILPGAPPLGQASKLVIGVGTGFNAAPVYETPTGGLVPPAEAGHGTLPTPDRESQDLAGFIQNIKGFCAVEDVLSGRGLGMVHDWILKVDGQGPTRDSAAVMAALTEDDGQAWRAAEAFLRSFGAVAGDLALTLLPFGGIYLIGGMSRAMAPYLTDHGFSEAFMTKGRFSEFMKQFPVFVVTDDDAALIGSARYLHDLLARS